MVIPMFQPFESHAHEWILRQEKAAEEYCQKSFADTPASQSNFERFIRSAAYAKPPIILNSFAIESYTKACSENLLEDNEYNEYDSGSFDLDTNLLQSVPISINKHKLILLPPAYIKSDFSFERQDPQNVHSKVEAITKAFIAIGGNLYQLREVIDYWLPKDTPDMLSQARVKWWPSQLVEQARLRTINEIHSINVNFTEHLQVLSNAIGDLREGAFGGRLNTKSVPAAKQMLDKLHELRRLILRMQGPASDQARSLKLTAEWFSGRCMGMLSELNEPYEFRNFDRNGPTQAHLEKLFAQHCSGIKSTMMILSNTFGQLSNMFRIIDCICKTMFEGLHKLMLEVHLGQTTGEFVASWAHRWERVTLALIILVLGLPSVNTGIQRSFPGMEIEFVDTQ